MKEINQIFFLKPDEGRDKVMPLKEAILENVKPGMNLYITPEGGAAICEIIRQFHSIRPRFVLTIIGTIEHAINLVHCGLARKLITSNCSHPYPSPGVSKVVQDAFRQKKVEIESWSLYSHIQRLMAGALGVGFLPTRSVVGSSMAEENSESFLEIADPFGGPEKIGLVKALNPDVSIVHGWAADRYGNTIGVPISSQAATDHKMWGAKASKKGVVVTVESIVPTSFIRKYASLVSLPGYLVNAVCHVPLGAHPQGMFSPVPGLFQSYAPDYKFVVEHRNASRDATEFDAWMENWVFDCGDHSKYLEKLGQKRIKALKNVSGESSEERDYQKPLEGLAAGKVANNSEIMILCAALRVRDIVVKNGYKIVLGGIGAGMLSSWIAYYLLKENGYDLDLVVGTGAFGFAPRPGDPFYGTYNNLPSCKALFDTSDIYGYVIGREKSASLSILGAAQIDKYGNINSTMIKDKFLMGSGGANDAVNASEVLIVAKQSKSRFVEKVPYVTCPGKKIKTIVSDMGIFQKVGEKEEFKLTACLPDPTGMGLDERIRKIRENCGWNLKVADSVGECPMPDYNVLSLLRTFDPEHIVIDP